MRHRPRPEATATGTILGLVPENRRRSFRHGIRNLAYAQVDDSGVGVVRDISEAGIAIQAVSSLETDQPVRLRLDLPSPRLRVEAKGRIAWTNSFGEAGIEFTELSPRTRSSLKEWIFTQVLADAYRLGGNIAEELLFSESARPPIRLDDSPALQARTRLLRRLRPSALSMDLARIVDGLVVLCAVLLFSIISLLMTDTLPAWYMALPLLAGVALVFWGLYWFLFAFWFGTTAGHHLAALAGTEKSHPVKQKIEEMRFR